jgi:hypothetical protein
MVCSASIVSYSRNTYRWNECLLLTYINGFSRPSWHKYASQVGGSAMSGKTGILYYSRSGHSKRLATRLAHELQGTLIEVSAPAYTNPVIGYARAGFDSLRQKCSLAPQSFSSLEEFDQVVLCGPVWTSYPAAPLRAILRDNARLPQAVALFVTSGGHSPAQKAFSVGEGDLGRPFAATASLPNGFEDSEREEALVERFLADLQAAQIVAE